MTTFTQGKRSLLPTKATLISACVWAVLIGIVCVYPGELQWSLKNLGGALRGRFAAPPEKMFLDAAIKQMDSGEKAKALLLQAEAIDPNLSTKYYLAVLALENDNVREAERLLLELLQIDETHLNSYLLLIELYSEAGRHLLAQEIATRGVDVFQERATLYDPIPSRIQRAEFRKSVNLHKQFENAGNILREKLSRFETVN